MSDKNTSAVLASLIDTAAKAIHEYKTHQGIAQLIGDIDDSHREEARSALDALLAFYDEDPSTRCGLVCEDKNRSVNALDAWEAIVAGCGVKGGTAHVRKGKMDHVKKAGKAIMSRKR